MWSSTFTIAAADLSGALTDFPIYLNIGATAGKSAFDLRGIFGELGASSLKLSIKDASNNQCYVEIVSWDATNKYAELHFKSSLSNSINNTFTITADNTMADNTAYVGVTGSTPAKAVWDSGFAAVYHMADATTSTILDSTSNANPGTKTGANNPAAVAGMLGSAQSFNGSTGKVYCGTAANLNTDAVTVEWYGAPTDLIPAWPELVARGRWGSENPFGLGVGARGNVYSLFKATTNAGAYWGYTITTAWQYLAVSYDSVGGVKTYADAVAKTGAAAAGVLNYTGAAPLYIGWAADNVNVFHGIIDEVRMSNTPRPTEWIAATNKTLKDTLVTFESISVSIQAVTATVSAAANAPTITAGALVQAVTALCSGQANPATIHADATVQAVTAMVTAMANAGYVFIISKWPITATLPNRVINITLE